MTDPDEPLSRDEVSAALRDCPIGGSTCDYSPADGLTPAHVARHAARGDGDVDRAFVELHRRFARLLRIGAFADEIRLEPAQALVEAAFRVLGGTARLSDLERETGFESSRLCKFLDRLEARGVVARVSHGLYRWLLDAPNSAEFVR
jgi:hypothetical protein